MILSFCSKMALYVLTLGSILFISIGHLGKLFSTGLNIEVEINMLISSNFSKTVSDPKECSRAKRPLDYLNNSLLH